MKWYQLSNKAVLHKMNAQPTGLTKTERETRLIKHGANKIEEKVQVKLQTY